MKRTFCLIATVTILMAALPAVAQVSDADYLQQLRADIQADRQALVAASLGLTDEEGGLLARLPRLPQRHGKGR